MRNSENHISFTSTDTLRYQDCPYARHCLSQHTVHSWFLAAASTKYICQTQCPCGNLAFRTVRTQPFLDQWEAVQLYDKGSDDVGERIHWLDTCRQEQWHWFPKATAIPSLSGLQRTWTRLLTCRCSHLSYPKPIFPFLTGVRGTTCIMHLLTIYNSVILDVLWYGK